MTAPDDPLSDFIRNQADVKTLPGEDDDLFRKLGIHGDDCGDFMDAFGQQFNVDLTDFLWYFHHGEEVGSLIGGLIFKPPYRRVKTIPITINLLRDAMAAGRWPVQYPPHTLPEQRWDLYFALLDPLVCLD